MPFAGILTAIRLNVKTAMKGGRFNMEDQPNIWIELLKGLTPVLLTSVALFVGMFVFMIVWVRKAVKNKMYCVYFEQNRHLGGELLPLPQGESQQMIEGHDNKMYMVDPDRQYFAKWPPGFPAMLQETVPVQVYNREDSVPIGTSRAAMSAIREHMNGGDDALDWIASNGNAPEVIKAIDPLHREPVVNAQVMANIQDTAFMQAAIRLASEHLGATVDKLQQYTFFAVLGLLGGLGILGYLLYQQSQAIAALSDKVDQYIRIIGG